MPLDHIDGEETETTDAVLLTIVVARYDESADWVRRLPSWCRVLIYQKDALFTAAQLEELNQRPTGTAFDDEMMMVRSPKVTQHPYLLRNIGRETHTYLRYIIGHYDVIPEAIVFTQGNPFPHNPHFLTDIQSLETRLRRHHLRSHQKRTGMLPDDSPPEIVFIPLGGAISSVDTSVHWTHQKLVHTTPVGDLTSRDAVSLPLRQLWRGLFGQHTQCVGKACASPEAGERARLLASSSSSQGRADWDSELPPRFLYTPGAIFVVSADAIHRRSKQFYLEAIAQYGISSCCGLTVAPDLKTSTTIQPGSCVDGAEGGRGGEEEESCGSMVADEAARSLEVEEQLMRDCGGGDDELGVPFEPRCNGLFDPSMGYAFERMWYYIFDGVDPMSLVKSYILNETKIVNAPSDAR